MQAVEWPSALVAISLITLIAVVMVIAMFRYKFSEAIQIWGAMGSIVGVLVGITSSYFFTRPVVRGLEKQLAIAKDEKATGDQRLAYYESLQAASAAEEYIPNEASEMITATGQGTDPEISTAEGRRRAINSAQRDALEKLQGRLCGMGILPKATFMDQFLTQTKDSSAHLGPPTFTSRGTVEVTASFRAENALRAISPKPATEGGSSAP